MDIVKQFGYGSAVVLKLAEWAGHSLFFDNYFPSFQLFEALKEKNIRAAGTIRINRFASPNVSDEKTLKKIGRGSSSESLSSNDAVIVTRWYDNKVVNPNVQVDTESNNAFHIKCKVKEQNLQI